MPRRCCDVFSAPACGSARFCPLGGSLCGQEGDRRLRWPLGGDRGCSSAVTQYGDDLGDRFLQVLEQIVEVLKVLPEQIARSFRSIGVCCQTQIIDGVRGVDSVVPQISEEIVDRVQLVDVGFPVPQIKEEMGSACRIVRRSMVSLCLRSLRRSPVDIVLSAPQERAQNLVGELIVGVPVPPVLEDGLPAVPQERVQNLVGEQLVDVPVPQITEAIVEDRFPEQLVDVPDASDSGGSRGNCAFNTSGERAESRRGADCGFPCA